MSQQQYLAINLFTKAKKKDNSMTPNSSHFTSHIALIGAVRPLKKHIPHVIPAYAGIQNCLK